MISQFMTWISLFCIKSLILNSGHLLLMILMKRSIWYSWSVACPKCLKIELLSRKILVFFVTFCHTYLALEKVIGMLPFFRQLSYTLLPRGKCKSHFHIIWINIIGSMPVCLSVWVCPCPSINSGFHHIISSRQIVSLALSKAKSSYTYNQNKYFRLHVYCLSMFCYVRGYVILPVVSYYFIVGP